MTTRSQPYRRNMPVHIIPLIKIAMKMTLFMVNQSGPTSFTFKDRIGVKHKVSIGNSLSCTCQRTNDHCIHSIYILLRMFKMDLNNPLIWQNSYLDFELNDIIAGKHSTQIVARSVITQMLHASEQFIEPMKTYHAIQPLVQKMNLGQDSQCPICQQPMSKQMCLTYCKIGCGNNFHLSCLKIWIQHKQSTQGRVTCPMCRCQYSNSLIESIKQQEQKYKQQQQKIKIRSMKFSCESCGKKTMSGILYKCLFCQNYCLCQQCFYLKKHVKHPFIKFNGEDWQGAQNRKQENTKLKQFLEKKRKEKYNTLEIIDKIKKVNLEPEKILDFVAGCFLYVAQYISQNADPYKKLDFRPEQVFCLTCGSTRMIFLRRLPCGHFIDHNCLKQAIVNKKFYCQKDGSKFLKGYQNLLKAEQQVIPYLNFTSQKQEQPRKSSRRSVNTFSGRHVQQPSPPQNQQTLITVLQGHNTFRQTLNHLKSKSQMQRNLMRNAVRNIQAISVPSQNQIRVRNLSVNNRKQPSQNKPKRRSSFFESHLAIQGQTMKRK